MSAKIIPMAGMLPNFHKEIPLETAWNDTRRRLGEPIVLLRMGRHDGWIWGRSALMPCLYDVRLADGIILPNIPEAELYDREGKALSVEGGVQ